MKIIKISDATHKRLERDKAHFSDVIGVPYTFDRTLQEYFKILNTLEYEEKERLKK